MFFGTGAFVMAFTFSDNACALGIPSSILSMVFWKIDGTDATPKGSLLNLYNPLCVLIIVY